MWLHDWLAAHSLTNHCNCLRKSCHLSLWVWVSVERTIQSRLCLISAENSCSRGVKERERGGVAGGQWSGGWGHFCRHFSVGSVSLKKNSKFVVGQSLSYSSGYQLLYIAVQYTLTLICIRNLCVSVIHRNMTRTARIFKVSTWSFDTSIDLYTCSVCIYLECVP